MPGFKSSPKEKILQKDVVGDSEFALVQSQEKFKVMKRQNGNISILSISQNKIESEASFIDQIKIAKDFRFRWLKR